uniref:Uncharacterized protein n=1 Tax=Catharus ustulatus TaxID=91951 RepID=A0A8C3UHS2_CATUS
MSKVQEGSLGVPQALLGPGFVPISLLGILPSHNTSRSTALAGAHCAHSQPGHAMGSLQAVHGGWLCVLGQHFTSSKVLPLVLRAQQQQQPLCQHVGPLCSLGHVPSSLGQAE